MGEIILLSCHLRNQDTWRSVWRRRWTEALSEPTSKFNGVSSKQNEPAGSNFSDITKVQTEADGIKISRLVDKDSHNQNVKEVVVLSGRKHALQTKDSKVNKIMFVVSQDQVIFQTVEAAGQPC